ncbi:MAG TPA: hypothetical protein VOA87_03005 [Thermoanaerobaculia bacterium]|nr:hypothetical protein [Thermoanaerobaculia bacterium]
MPKSSYARETASWDKLAIALAREAGELPVELAEHRARLEEVVKRARTLHNRQASQDARLRQTSRELREELALGREIESRVRAYLRGRFGARSVALVGFGGRPLRRRRRTEVPSLDAPETAPAEGPELPDAAEGEGSPN